VYDYGARFYDPQIGRWHSMDPEIELHQDYTPYSYVYNNPISYFDPFGLDTAVNQSHPTPIKEVVIKGYRSPYWILFSNANSDANNLEWSRKELDNSANTGLFISTMFLPIPFLDDALGLLKVAKIGKVLSKLGVKDITELLAKYDRHIFSQDHILKGIMDLGTDKAEILDKVVQTIEKNSDNLKDGSNFILENINGHEATVKVFLKDGEIMSIDAYKGIPTRQYGNVINNIQK